MADDTDTDKGATLGGADVYRFDPDKKKDRKSRGRAKAGSRGGAGQGTNPDFEKQADALVRLANDGGVRLFYDGRDDGFADVHVSGHRETYKVRSQMFKLWLTRQYYLHMKSGPSPDALNAAVNTLEAQSRFDGERRETYVRVADDGDRLFVDLCNDKWQVVEISPYGWRVTGPPDAVRFRRAPGMGQLPAPVCGGSVVALRPFLNVKYDCDFTLAVSWILGALRAGPGYPVLVLTGEQGSAKSTFSQIMRKLVDPNAALLRSVPRSDHDLHISANNSHVLAFDNVSNISARLSDALCVISTGGGWAGRRLYTDENETIFNSSRPIILNGIVDVVNRPDLADRSLFLELEPIPEADRKFESVFMREFNNVLPAILGALLDGCVHGLRALPETHLGSVPRMADFARWAVACEGALWSEPRFLSAYRQNRAGAVEAVVEGDAVASNVRRFMADRDEWAGTPTALYEIVSDLVLDGERKSKGWPKTARTFSGRLKRAATFLRQLGLEVNTGLREGTRNRARRIVLRWLAPEVCNSASATSDESGADETAQKSAGYSADERRTQNGAADDGCVRQGEVASGGVAVADASDTRPDARKADCVQKTVNENSGLDDTNDTDAKLHTLRGRI